MHLLLASPTTGPAHGSWVLSSKAPCHRNRGVQRGWCYLDPALWARPARGCVKPLGETEKGENRRSIPASRERCTQGPPPAFQQTAGHGFFLLTRNTNV